MKALHLCAAVAAILFSSAAAAQNAQSPYAPTTKALTIEQISGTRIYYSIGVPGVPGKDNEGNTSNAGFVITDEGVLVFDALGTPSLGWAMLQEIKKRTDKKIRYVVLSHYHADHIYGLQAFKDHTDAIMVAQDRAREYKENDDEIADERVGERLNQRRSALSPWVNESTRVVPPDITFSQRATINLGKYTFTMIYGGPAHSASDMMMMVQPEGVLFAGDIVQNGRIPFMNSDDVDSGVWLAALDEVLKLNPQFIVPGHGKPSTQAKEAITFTRDYIAYVRDAMGEAVENWIEFEAAYAQTDWSKYKNLPAFDSINKGNAYRIFLDIEAKNFKK